MTSVLTPAKSRDFSVTNTDHEDIAKYVNDRSGIAPVTANQVKAILTLKPEWFKSPERTAAKAKKLAERNAAKLAKAEAEARYASLTPEQRVAVKKAEKAALRAQKLKEEAAKLFG